MTNQASSFSDSLAVAEMLRHTGRVTLQLSNLCNYTHLHNLCPTSVFKTKQILPKAVICDVVDSLAAAGFDVAKALAWHVYNDPLIDPRLAWLCEYARKRLPAIEIVLFTTRRLDREAVNRRVREAGLSALHNIRRVIHVEQIPVLGTGKTDYRTLRERLDS